jgi:hypothetical protein
LHNKIKSIYGCEPNAFSNIFVTDWQRHLGGPAWKLPHTSSNKNKLYQEKCIKSNSRVAKVLPVLVTGFSGGEQYLLY